MLRPSTRAGGTRREYARRHQPHHTAWLVYGSTVAAPPYRSTHIIVPRGTFSVAKKEHPST